MKITSWNVNSVRARILNIKDYIKQSDPDILMMQEIKTEEKSFPYTDFDSLGYKYLFLISKIALQTKLSSLSD